MVLKSRRVFISLGIFFALLFPLGSVAYAQFGLSRLPGYKVLQCVNYISRFYVDSVDNDAVIDDAIRSLMEQLDPHSSYITREEAKEVSNELEGHFYGIGVEFQILHDTLRVMSAVPNGPAEKVGMRSGDRILKVNGENIAGVGLSNQKVFKLLRGEKGTLVEIEALRHGTPYDFKIHRGELPIHSVDVSYMIRPGIGYVRLNRFALNSTKEMLDALHKLEKKGMKRLMLDLRGNGGGIMPQAVSIASLFLKEGLSVMYAQGRAMPKQEYFAEAAENDFRKMPLVVLVDEYSASASEILSGALQDWDRAVIVGRRTFGKGLVQNQVPLSDGSLIRVTVARYYTPSGRSVQTPYELGKAADYRKKFADRYKQGEVFAKDSVHLNDSMKYTTLRSRRTVFAGGGIMPDVFVPIDTTGGSVFVGSLIRKALDNDWLTNYYDRHQDELREQYKSFKAFMKGWQIDSSMVAEIVSLAKTHKVAVPKEGLNADDRKLLGWRMKALLARRLYGFSYMIEALNEHSDEVLRGVKILEHWEKEGAPLLK